jgi:putative ABC transport system permease protein
MMQVFDRPGFNSVVLRVAPGTSPQALIQRIAEDPRLQAEAKVQTDYYASQTGMLGGALKFLGVFLSTVMAIGSAFGATNTLLASLQGRRREIGTLLSIGYRPLHIYFGFLLEAGLLGGLGGVLGLLLALPLHGLGTGTMNWSTFTEQAFSFQISPSIALTALLFGSFVGLFGGTFPAWRASRLRPTEALRAL